MPTVAADVVMTEPGSGRVLMAERVVYGAPGIGSNVETPVGSPYTAIPDGFLGSATIIVPYETGYSFKKVDGFTKDNPEKASEGLRLALEYTAQAITELVTTTFEEPDTPAEQVDVDNDPAEPVSERSLVDLEPRQ